PPRRLSSGSLTSGSENEAEHEPSPPVARRGRRSAIYETKIPSYPKPKLCAWHRRATSGVCFAVSPIASYTSCLQRWGHGAEA
ncbi:hypothetical protein BaRGS_00024415, partial [Batillaria attramentaria]